MSVIWTSRATRELVAIADYINQHNPAAAIAVRDRIRQSVERLVHFPLSGRPGRIAETREIVVTGAPYIATYRVRNERVEILGIFHAARDPLERE